MSTLGIDLAVRAAHVATLTNDQGEVIWSRRRFRSHPPELAALSAAAGPASELTVVIEPTRSAWVVVAAHFRATGAKVVMMAPERSADLRSYYKKHTKNDHLDSFVLSRVPLLHPEGLIEVTGLGPADPLKRAVRRRVRLVGERHGCHQRVDAMLDLLGPSYNEALGTRDTRTVAVILERYGSPKSLRRLGISRLTDLVRRTSGGHFGAEYASRLMMRRTRPSSCGEAAASTSTSWPGTSPRRSESSDSSEVEIGRLDARIAELYAAVDPKGIARSAPGVGPVLGAGIVGRLGDVNRFANLAGVRSFTGIVPGVNQSGLTETRPGITKQGDPGLRRDLFFAADMARHHDPQLAAKYHRLIVERRLHHYAAVCHVATTLVTRIAACWRSGQHYVVETSTERPVTPVEARAIIAERYAIPPEARRRARSRTQ